MGIVWVGSVFVVCAVLLAYLLDHCFDNMCFPQLDLVGDRARPASVIFGFFDLLYVALFFVYVCIGDDAFAIQICIAHLDFCCWW